MASEIRSRRDLYRLPPIFLSPILGECAKFFPPILKAPFGVLSIVGMSKFQKPPLAIGELPNHKYSFAFSS